MFTILMLKMISFIIETFSLLVILSHPSFGSYELQNCLIIQNHDINGTDNMTFQCSFSGIYKYCQLFDTKVNVCEFFRQNDDTLILNDCTDQALKERIVHTLQPDNKTCRLTVLNFTSDGKLPLGGHLLIIQH